MGYRSSVVVLLVFVMVLPGMAALPGPMTEGRDPGPPVDKPTGDGPYQVGYIYDDVATTTKVYTVGVKIYYPAQSSGQGSTINNSGAPYPTIVWLPGFGGNEGHYVNYLQRLSSWGFVVMAVGVNWDDWPSCSNVTDMEDYLDYLETRNATPADGLYQMIDKLNFGLSGHSSGGGLSLVDGAYVDRIRAVQPFAAAIGVSAVDSIAQDWDKPLLLQVGKDDSTYIGGSRRAYEKIGAIISLVEIINVGHQGPYESHLFAAFYLYHLDGQTDYETYLYEEEAVADYLRSDYDLWFNFSAQRYFPPVVTAQVSNDSVMMDTEVGFQGDIDGYWPPGHSQAKFVWDIDNDMVDDFTDPVDMNATHIYTDPGNYEAMFRFELGRLKVEIEQPLPVFVQNVVPVAMAGEDVEVEEDEAVPLDAGGSFDTVSDNDTLEFKWTFGDGSVRDYSTDPKASHSYTKEGTYEAEVTVRDRHGATVSDDLTVNVTNVVPRGNPGGHLFADEDELVEFDGTGIDSASDMGGLKFKWDFGEGNGTEWADTATATHVYTEAKDYDATFWVKDDDGAIGSQNVTVTISNVAPTGDITLPENGTSYDEDALVEMYGWGQDTTSDQNGLMFLWIFGDGGSTEWSLEPTTDHTYSKAGTYTVEFFVRDDDLDTVNMSVLVVIDNVAPTAEIVEPASDITVLEDESVILKGTGSDTPSDIDDLRYHWEIGSDVEEGAELALAFFEPGTHDISFVVTDLDGETARDEVTVTVMNKRPSIMNASVMPKMIAEGEAISFYTEVSDTANDLYDIIVEWDFGDGTTSWNMSGDHTYEAPGSYKVTLKVRDDDGAEDEKTFTVAVDPKSKPPKPPKPDDDGEGLSALMIGGIGALIAIIIIVLVLLFLKRGKATPGPGPVYDAPTRPDGTSYPDEEAPPGPGPETDVPPGEEVPPDPGPDVPPKEEGPDMDVETSGEQAGEQVEDDIVPGKEEEPKGPE